MPLGPGVSVLTGRNNVGKSRMLEAVITVMTAYSNSTLAPDAPQIRIEEDGVQVIADFHGFPAPRLYEIHTQGRTEHTFWGRDGAGNWRLVHRRPGPPDGILASVQGRVAA